MSFLSSSYISSFVGFDSLFDELERMSSIKKATYPAYDIKKISTDEFIIVIALAGFNQDDLSVEIKGSELTVAGNGEKNSQENFIHKGIARRAFSRVFRLADKMEVNTAEFKDGLLSICIQREPENDVSRKIIIRHSL